LGIYRPGQVGSIVHGLESIAQTKNLFVIIFISQLDGIFTVVSEGVVYTILPITFKVVIVTVICVMFLAEPVVIVFELTVSNIFLCLPIFFEEIGWFSGCDGVDASWRYSFLS
jgi:hypothetical protein